MKWYSDPYPKNHHDNGSHQSLITSFSTSYHIVDSKELSARDHISNKNGPPNICGLRLHLMPVKNLLACPDGYLQAILEGSQRAGPVVVEGTIRIVCQIKINQETTI